jgi:hypothetical protein
MIDVTPVPDRFKKAISQTENEDILDCLFAKIVIDAVNLLFLKNLTDLAVEFAGRGEIMSKRFFDDYACPALAVSIQSSRTEPLNNFRILAWWRRKVKNAIAIGTTFLVKLI